MSLTRFGLTDLLTCIRASTALVRSAAGVYSSAANNVLRVSHEGGSFCLLAEENRTNSLPRSNVDGAALGTLDDTGALPTGWAITGIATSAVEVLSVADKNGLPRIQLRFNGTPTGNVTISPAIHSTAIAASEGQTWAASVFVQRTAGAITNLDQIRTQILTTTSAGPVAGNNNSADFKDTISDNLRRTLVWTVVGADTAIVATRVALVWTSGAIDITLDISAPQLEQGAFATSPIITDGTAVTRQRDQIKLNDGLLAQVYGGGPVSVLSEFEMEYVTSGTGSGRVWQMDAGSSANTLTHRVGEASNNMAVLATLDGANRYSHNTDYTSGAAIKIATRFQSGAYANSYNGGTVNTGANSEFPTGLINMGISNAGFNTTANTAPLLRLRKLIVYPTALTNAELEALSA